MQATKRKIKLILPRIQLTLTMTFVGLTALAFLLQVMLFMNSLSELAMILPSDGPLLMTHINSSIGKVLLVSFAAFLPLTFAVGILATFRIAGPLYRFEQFLREIKDGGRPADIRLRKGDGLKHLAALLSEVTAPLRAETGDEASPPQQLDLEEVASLTERPAAPSPREEAPSN